MRASLQNAASVASLLLTIEALMGENPEKKAAGVRMPEMMGGMGM